MKFVRDNKVGIIVTAGLIIIVWAVYTSGIKADCLRRISYDDGYHLYTGDMDAPPANSVSLKTDRAKRISAPHLYKNFQNQDEAMEYCRNVL